MKKTTKTKKTKPNTREKLQEQFPDTDLLFMTKKEFDDAIIGVIEGKAHEPAVAYDYDKVIAINVKDGMTYFGGAQATGF